jgi:hypothetical protein
MTAQRNPKRNYDPALYHVRFSSSLDNWICSMCTVRECTRECVSACAHRVQSCSSRRVLELEITNDLPTNRRRAREFILVLWKWSVWLIAIDMHDQLRMRISAPKPVLHMEAMPFFHTNFRWRCRQTQSPRSAMLFSNSDSLSSLESCRHSPEKTIKAESFSIYFFIVTLTSNNLTFASELHRLPSILVFRAHSRSLSLSLARLESNHPPLPVELIIRKPNSSLTLPTSLATRTELIGSLQRMQMNAFKYSESISNRK